MDDVLALLARQVSALEGVQLQLSAHLTVSYSLLDQLQRIEPLLAALAKQ